MSDRTVVDPLGVPTAGRRRARSIPILAAVFIALFVLAAIARLTGISGVRLSLPGDLGSWLVAVLSIDLVILLPAVALARSPDAATALRVVFRGLVLIAVATFLRTAASALDRLLPGVVGADPLTGAPGVGSFLLSAAISTIGALGVLVLALGLWPASRRATSVTRMVLAGLVTLAVVVAVGVQAIATLVGSPPWNSVVAGDVGTAVALTCSYVAGYLQAIAWAPLAWVLVRLATSDGTPARLAGAGVAVATAAYFSLTMVSVVAAEAVSALGSIVTTGSVALALASSVLLVAAFALGLAEAARPPAAPVRARPDRRMPKYRR